MSEGTELSAQVDSLVKKKYFDPEGNEDTAVVKSLLG